MSESRSNSTAPILFILPMMLLLLFNHHDTTTAHQVTSTPIDFSTPISNAIEYFKSFGIMSILFVVMLTGIILWKLYERRKYMWMFMISMLVSWVMWWVFGDLSSFLKPFNIGMLHH